MSRRGRNEESIYKRLDGRWVASVSIEDGKRKYFYGKTRQEVQRLLAAGLHDYTAGLPIVSDRQTVAHYLRDWIDAIWPTVDVSTWKRHREYVEFHIVPGLGFVRLRELSPQLVQRLYADRLVAGLSSST